MLTKQEDLKKNPTRKNNNHRVHNSALKNVSQMQIIPHLINKKIIIYTI